jgi:hypothetical protein
MTYARQSSNFKVQRSSSFPYNVVQSQPNDHALTVALALPPARNATPFAQRINTQCPCVLRQRHRRLEDDTKKSFDFMDELKKLNESGGSDRLSFVEQPENVFRTPANLRYDFDLMHHPCPRSRHCKRNWSGWAIGRSR